MSFKHILHAEPVKTRHLMREYTISGLFHFPLIIQRVPVTFAVLKIEMMQGIGLYRSDKISFA